MSREKKKMMAWFVDLMLMLDLSMALTKMEVASRRLNRWDSEDVVHHATMVQPMNSNRSMR